MTETMKAFFSLTVFGMSIRVIGELPDATCQCQRPSVEKKGRHSGVRRVRWDRAYRTNFDQFGPDMAKLDQLGQAGRHFAVFCFLEQF